MAADWLGNLGGVSVVFLKGFAMSRLTTLAILIVAQVSLAEQQPQTQPTEPDTQATEPQTQPSIHLTT